MAQATLWSQEGFPCDCESAYRLYKGIWFGRHDELAKVCAEINAPICEHGFTMLQYTIQIKNQYRKPHLKLITLLLMNGANTHVTDDMGNTLLHQAITMSLPRLMTVSMRRDKAMNLHIPDPASKERQDLINFLCPFIDINSKNHNGETALMLAISSNDHTSAMTLIRRPGIDLKARDLFGRTALDRVKYLVKDKPEFVEVEEALKAST